MVDNTQPMVNSLIALPYALCYLPFALCPILFALLPPLCALFTSFANLYKEILVCIENDKIYTFESKSV
jgi:hypothetical protein